MTQIAGFRIRLATQEDAATMRDLQWLLWDHHHRLAPQKVHTADEIMAAGPEPEASELAGARASLE